MFIVGLAGPAMSGKDTVADRLQSLHGFSKIAFADPVYAGVSAAFGIPISDLKDRRLKEEIIPWIGRSPRQLLQWFGTEYGRLMVSKTIWLDIAGRTLDKIQMQTALKGTTAKVVISDVRFENEAAWIRERGGIVWHINRPGTDKVHGHSSEAGVDFRDGDMRIDNTGTLDHLLSMVDTAVLSEAYAKVTAEAGLYRVRLFFGAKEIGTQWLSASSLEEASSQMKSLEQTVTGWDSYMIEGVL